MRTTLIILVALFFHSCIPYSIAPKINDHKIKKSNRFEAGMPKDYSFIFEDPKEVNEFYQFMNAKFKLADVDIEQGIMAEINDDLYFLNFYEAEKSTRTLNLVPILIDANRENNGNDPILEEFHTMRDGKWFIMVIVSDDEGKDALHPDHPEQIEVRRYLKRLRDQYLNTQNYLDTYFSD